MGRLILWRLKKNKGRIIWKVEFMIKMRYYGSCVGLSKCNSKVLIWVRIGCI